jgi:hypothetical protein
MVFAVAFFQPYNSIPLNQAGYFLFYKKRQKEIFGVSQVFKVPPDFLFLNEENP